MISVDELLAPVSDELPCGENLSYDTSLSELETMLQGQEETQFAAAADPNWREVQKACVALYGKTKDLRVTVALDVALLQLDQLPGFAQGLELLHGLVTKYWKEFYPRLDPDDNDDPTERMNIIGTLTMPEGTFGDTLRVVSRLRQVPLCRSVVAGSFSLAQIIDAGKPPPPPPEADAFGDTPKPTSRGTDLGVVRAAFLDTPKEFLDTQFEAVNKAISTVKAIDTALSEAVGADRSTDFAPLTGILREILAQLTTYAPPLLPEGESAPGDAQAGEGGGGRRGPSAPGTIGSRDDVTRAIDAICAYYAAQEPSSPVPALLLRAKELVGLGFLDIVKVLTPDATPSIRLTPPADSGGF